MYIRCTSWTKEVRWVVKMDWSLVLLSWAFLYDNSRHDVTEYSQCATRSKWYWWFWAVGAERAISVPPHWPYHHNISFISPWPGGSDSEYSPSIKPSQRLIVLLASAGLVTRKGMSEEGSTGSCIGAQRAVLLCHLNVMRADIKAVFCWKHCIGIPDRHQLSPIRHHDGMTVPERFIPYPILYQKCENSSYIAYVTYNVSLFVTLNYIS